MASDLCNDLRGGSSKNSTASSVSGMACRLLFGIHPKRRYRALFVVRG